MQGNEDDRRAILQLVADETTAYWSKDYDAWAACWVQEPAIRRLGWWTLGGVTYREGWGEIGGRMKRLIAEMPVANRSASEVRRENINIRIGGDMAWMTFDQYAGTTGEPRTDMPGLSRELRILERHGGRWKFAASVYLHHSLHHIASALIRVDGEGRVEWMNRAAEEALAGGCGLAVWHGRLRAVSREGEQRLQAAIRWAAGLDDGIESRRATLPVVLEGGRGDPANVLWIIADSGLIHISVNDARLAEERLETAAVVYGLSPSQIRLAGEIIGGRSLGDAAEKLRVSVATTRTQLQRIFDKTGVRSQPALVRALLSVAAPLA